MCTDCEKSKSGNMPRTNSVPLPGEIWELNRQIRFPEEFTINEKDKLYSIEANNFLQGNTPPRYVIIVTEPEVDIVSVMVLSTQTNFISDVDLVIPAYIIGLAQDLLAETWHVQPMLVCNLLQLVGKRVSRDIYDMLLNVGGYYNGLLNHQPEIDDIERLGLKLGIRKALETPEIIRFHQQEKAWSDVLTIPVAAYHTYIKCINFTNDILGDSLQIDRDLWLFRTQRAKMLR